MAATILILVSAMALLVTGGLTVLVMRNPEAGLARIDHHVEDLPQVLAGRYLTFFVLALGAAIYADPIVFFGLFVAFAVASAADTIIYARKGKKYGPHLAAGIASVTGAGLSLIAAGAN
ncbi:MAG: hypothetical protein HKP37_02715 [Boseongicola sp.]|nr:hypothetical protein [Boseongicola sp.]NNL17632.1 hypothetical protein [Boseongicola sp.]